MSTSDIATGRAPRTNKHKYGEQAFWVKGTEAEMAKEKTLAVILRHGDRSDQVRAPQQWLPLLEPIPVYCISVPGDQANGIEAQFERDQGLTVQIVRRTVTRLGDIRHGDLQFMQGYAVPQTPDDILPYLTEDLAPGKVFESDTLMTVYWVEYLPDEESAVD